MAGSSTVSILSSGRRTTLLEKPARAAAAVEQGRGQADPWQRQTRRQGGPRAGAAVDARQLDQAVEQRVVVQLILREAFAQMQCCLSGPRFFLLFFAHARRDLLYSAG
jgi:hypothetical protein